MSALRLSLVRSTLGAVAIGSIFASTAAFAATTGPTAMTVSAQVQAACTLGTIAAPTLTGLAYDSAGTGQGSVTVTCTQGSPYHIEISGGVGGTIAQRIATGTTATNTLKYGLYRDAAWTENWGVTDLTDTFDGAGQGATAVTTPIYMKVDPTSLAAAAADTYSDTVNVTVTY